MQEKSLRKEFQKNFQSIVFYIKLLWSWWIAVITLLWFFVNFMVIRIYPYLIPNDQVPKEVLFFFKVQSFGTINDSSGFARIALFFILIHHITATFMKSVVVIGRSGFSIFNRFFFETEFLKQSLDRWDQRAWIRE